MLNQTLPSRTLVSNTTLQSTPYYTIFSMIVRCS